MAKHVWIDEKTQDSFEISMEYMGCENDGYDTSHARSLH